MKNSFGQLLRTRRSEAGLSMGALARELEVSVTYLSDVERGTRAPLSSDRIKQAAALMKLDKAELRELDEAAAESRGFFELVADNLSSTGRQVGATLMRGWPSYSDSDFERLMKLLRDLEGE